MGFYLKTLTALFVASVAFFAYSQQGCAGGEIAKQTCDTKVWKTMEDRAHMEAEREIMQNQNLIFKPDSILAYTCFDNMAAHASLYVGQLFTHTKYWNGKEIIEWGDPYGMDVAMQKVVIDSLKPYIKGSFEYTMLGGRGSMLSSSGLGLQTPKDIGNKGRTYSCDVMNNVWKAAKCMNFIHNSVFSTTDGFYPFIGLEPVGGGSKIAGYDEIKETRKYPSKLACSDSTGKPLYNKEGWMEGYRDSRNETDFGVKDRYYQFGTPLDQAFIDVRKKLEPGKCSEGGAIKTGVRVLQSPSGDGEVYDDGVCTNPGCVYDRGGTCKAAGS